MSQAQPSSQFAIQRLYLKDVSFEVPGAPDIYSQGARLEVNLQVNHQHRTVGDDPTLVEVSLKLAINAKQGERTAYIVEVDQGGLFALKNFSDAQREQLLAAYCPGLLYPYAREAVDNLVVKGGFAPLMLKPIDFAALYYQRKAQQAEHLNAPSGDRAN
ncbi:MAG: protein-export chaperone SecB [Candidatus Competibacterales bacterium]